MDIAEIGFAANTGELVKADEALERLGSQARKTEKDVDRLNDELGDRTPDKAKRAKASVDSLSKGLGALTGVLRNVAIGFATAFGAGALIEITNTWTDLNSRVNIAAGSMEKGAVVMQRIESMARRTYSSLTLTAESWLLNANAMREMGYSTQQSLDYTEALNNALVVSGAKGERAESVVNALSKAMALGKLSGDQLETVMASGGRVAQLLAEHLGVTTTQLRKLGSEGKLTSQVLFEALSGGLEAVRKEADSMAYTIGDAFVLLGNSLTSFIGRLDATLGVSQAVATAIIWVADNLDIVAQVATVAGAALIAAFGPATIAMIVGGVIAGMKAIGAAIMAHPFGFLLTAIVTIITAVWTFRDAIRDAFGIDVVQIVRDAGNWIIRTMLTAFENAKFVWGNFPGIMQSAMIGAVNFVIINVNKMIAATIGGINALIKAIPPWLRGGETGGLIDENFGQIPTIDGSGVGPNAVQQMLQQAKLGQIGKTDYMGGIMGSLGMLTTETDTSKLALASLTDTTSGLGNSMDDASKKTDKEKDALKRLAKEAKEAQDRIQEIKDTISDLASSFIKGFIADIRNGVSAVDALTNAFGKLADKLMDMVIDQAINALIGSLIGAAFGGGGLSPMASAGWSRLWPSARGNVFAANDNLSRYSNSVVSRPTKFATGGLFGNLMGEARPEAVMPLTRGAGGVLGVRAWGAANDSRQVVVQLNVEVQNNAGDQVEATTRMGDDGKTLIVMVDKIVADNINNRSSKTNAAMRASFGLNNAVKQR